MLKEIAQEARDRIAAQPVLAKERASYTVPPNCTCVAIALGDATHTYNSDIRREIWSTFLVANKTISQQKDEGPFGAIVRWNDDPQTTHAGAVAALDNLVNYLDTQEGE